MKHRNTQALYQYWHRQKGARRAPDRADIQPGDIQHLLADTFILELGDNAAGHYRLAGTRLCAMFGQELRNADFRFLWAPADRERVTSAVSILQEDSLGVLIGWQGRTNNDHRVAGELMLLPLTLNHEGVVRALGIASALALPYWLGSIPLVELSIVSLRILDPASRDIPGLATGEVFAKPAAPFEPLATGARRVGHLAVYDGGLNQ